MDSNVLDLLRMVSVVVFAGLGVIALQLRRRHKVPAAGWASAAFGVLGAVVLVGRVNAQLAEGSPTHVGLRVLSVAALVTFPYLLFRFSTALEPASARMQRVADVTVVTIMTGSAVLAPFFPQGDDSRPGWFALYLLVLLGYWTTVSVYVAVRMWRGGQRQPTPARRRMRLLATASLLLNAGLLLAGGASGTAAEGQLLPIITQLLAIAAGVTFGLAFAPPQVVRASWRRPEEQLLRQAETKLMVATTREEIAGAVLPAIANLLGGGAAALYDGTGDRIRDHGKGALPRKLVTPAIDPQDSELEMAAEHLIIPLRSGTLLLETSPFSPFFSQDELELLQSIGVSVDLALSRLQHFEQERRAREALERTNEELQALVYGISHDLRNPLVTILGYVDLLKADYSDRLGDEGAHFVQRIDASAGYMDALIQDLLELSRVGRMQAEVENVDLGSLLADIADNVAAGHPDATFDLQPLPKVAMSPVRARQLFTNLLQNAVVHGGRPDITVTVSATTAEEGVVVISVADDGEGIPAAYRERVFGIFERLRAEDRSEPGGTGIGLAICRKIVQELGGSIEFADALIGAEIQIRLPLSVLRPTAVMEVAT